MHEYWEMNIIRDYVVVKVPSVFIDDTGVKGIDGKKLIFNVFHQPERHTRNWGTVVSVPQALSRFPVLQDPSSSLGAHSRHTMRFKRMEDIDLGVRVGDKVYFHYNCLLPDSHTQLYNFLWLYSRKEMFRGEEVAMQYFRIKYDLLFAAVRYHKCFETCPDFKWDWEQDLKPCTVPLDPCADTDLRYGERHVHGDDVYRKEVEMIGSYMFVEIDMETWEDISVPIPETLGGKPLRDKNNQVVYKPKDQWLVTKSQPTERYLQGWIRHVGKPLNGDPQELQEGMRIHFRPYANTKMMFEGKEYFRMRQRHVYAYYPLQTETA